MRWTRFLARLALVAVAGVAMTAAQAQTTGTIVGTIQDASNGNPISGALVIAQSPSLQGEQTALTSDEGTFRITLLPPGMYTVLVQADGYRPGQKKGIGIDIDKTIRVTLQLVPKALKAKEVVVRATAPVIDQGSTTSGAVINEDFTKNVPTGTGFQSVLNVAPGATSDGLGTTFRGSSSPENNWIIDGVRTTDVANGNGGTGLPTFFVKQVEVKTGGYMAEYGQATGGVVNVVTRSGGNEFHGDAFVRFNSAALNATGKTIKGTANVVNATSQAGLNADFGFDLGGYIIKDKLWFFVGVVPHQATTNYTRTVTPAKYDTAANGGAGGYVYDAQGNQVYGDPISSLTKNLSFNALTIQRMAKLTWNVDENNSAQVSYFGDPGSGSGVANSSLNGDLPSISQDIGGGNQDLAVRWTSKLFNKKMLVKAWYGLHYETSSAVPVANDAYYKTNPIATIHMDPGYIPADFQNVPGCSITYTPTAGPDAGNSVTKPLCTDYLYSTGPFWYQNKNTMTRNAANIGFTNFFDLAGHNELKYGADFQQNRYLNEYGYANLYAMRDYSNSRGYMRRQSLGDAVMDASGNVTGWTPRSFRVSDGHTFDTGVYLQDSYSPIEGLAINPGIRWETQNIWGHSSTAPGVSITNNWAPRVGVTYDWTGTGRSKVEAYYGRFFEAIPMDINSRAFGGEVFAFQWLSPDGKTNLTPLLGLPTTPATNGSGGWYLLEDGSSDYVVPHLSGEYVDEFSGGVQYEVLPDLAVGATLVHRALGRVIEDVSPDNGGTYILANPGDTSIINAGTKTLETQLKADGGTVGTNPDGTPAYDCPASAKNTCQTTLDHLNLTRGVAQFPAPIRNYDALELTVRKNFSNSWYLIGSLTFSRTYGNYPGLYSPGNGQLDPNITSLYDLPKLMVNRVGPLYNDRPVYFKLDGYYLWDFGLVTGVSLRAYSGRPINVLAADSDYGSNETFLLPRGAAGRTPPLFNVDVNVGYQLKVAGDVKVSINANIFNLLDSQQTAAVSNTFTYDVAYPVVGGQLSDIQTSDGTPTVKGPDGNVVTKNPDFMKVTATSQLQSPLAARLDLRVSF